MLLVQPHSSHRSSYFTDETKNQIISPIKFLQLWGRPV